MNAAGGCGRRTRPGNATGHTAGLYLHPAEWESRVISFLDASLG